MARAKLESFEEGCVALAGFAKVLAHPARICILRYLAGRGEVPCMEIVKALPLSQSTCSRHINELRKAGLLTARAEGSNVWFCLDEQVLQGFCRGMSAAMHPGSAGPPCQGGNSPCDEL